MVVVPDVPVIVNVAGPVGVPVAPGLEPPDEPHPANRSASASVAKHAKPASRHRGTFRQTSAATAKTAVRTELSPRPFRPPMKTGLPRSSLVTLPDPLVVENVS